MERLLARLERRLGRFAITNLTLYLVVLTGVVFVLGQLKPEFYQALVFDPARIRQGQVWRIFTFLFLPRSDGIWVIFELWMLWMVGNTLNTTWGSLKYNLFYFLGALGTIAASVILGVGMTNEFITVSLFLAFATLFPDYQLLLFIIPVRAKWLGLVSAAFLVYTAVVSTRDVKIAIAVSMANYLLFFSGTLLRVVRGAATVAGSGKRKAEVVADEAPRATRKCVLCELTDDDPGADLRVCTCEAVCGGKPTIYCLAHARSHNKAS